MFERKTALQFAEHRNLKIHETNNYEFARSEILAPFVFDEMADIAREYPIVFPDNGSDLPSALLGLEAGQNAYVGSDGIWQGTYIPAHIRRYPFLFGTLPGENPDPNRFIILFDPDAPHFRDPNGYRVFTDKGELSDHMKRRIELLEQIQKNIDRTRVMVRELTASGILVERAISIRREGQQERRITGIRVVDENMLNQLPDAEFNALHQKGLLPLIYSQLLSWANFRQGPLGGKYPDLAAKTATKNPVFLFESDLVDLSSIT